MRILVAEDERNLNRILTEALTDEGYSVDPCFDGQEAWDALACAEYDVLVLDIMMPRMDGLTLVRKLRESGSTTPSRPATASRTRSRGWRPARITIL